MTTQKYLAFIFGAKKIDVNYFCAPQKYKIDFLQIIPFSTNNWDSPKIYVEGNKKSSGNYWFPVLCMFIILILLVSNKLLGSEYGFKQGSFECGCLGTLGSLVHSRILFCLLGTAEFKDSSVGLS